MHEGSIYDRNSAELRVPELTSVLERSPQVTAADFGRFGPSRVQRAWLGRVSELSPSRTYWGPLYLASWLDDPFPFDFEALAGCDRCCDDAVERWLTRAEMLAPCTSSDPCNCADPELTHCAMCRDSAWFSRLFRQALLVDAVLQHGEIDRGDLYVARLVSPALPS
jgi:hypothetical protein